MLSKEKILNLAVKYLKQNEFPILESSGVVTFPEEEKSKESQEFLEENMLACASFEANFDYNPDDPHQHLVPHAFIVYVNYGTGDVFMPRHMA